MRKLRKLIIAAPAGEYLSVREMQTLSGGSQSLDIYKCTCYVLIPTGAIATKNTNVKAFSTSQAADIALKNDCAGYTSAYCEFFCHINGTH